MNKRAYEVVLTDGDTQIVEANEVQETATRVKFVGHVPGHNDNSFDNVTIQSYRDSDVKSYRLVPLEERNDKAEGKHLYRVNFKTGKAKDVQGDYVKHSPGSNGLPGWYSIGTAQVNNNGNSGRTEFLVPEDQVLSIERVVTADVPAQADFPA